jgi:hypothetical protein
MRDLWTLPAGHFMALHRRIVDFQPILKFSIAVLGRIYHTAMEFPAVQY